LVNERDSVVRKLGVCSNLLDERFIESVAP
jgi:hypothetical protein